MRRHAAPAPGSPPRGGDLLARLAADLVGCRLEPGDGGGAVVSVDGRPSFRLEVHDERRKLLTLQTSVAVVPGPPSDADTQLVFHHRGQIRRTGLGAKVRGRDRDVGAALLETLLAEGELEAASLPLDFTRFVVAPQAGRWCARLELMGGSHVRTTLPPSSRYVRLVGEQRDALLATIEVLRRRLPVDDDALGRSADAAVPTSRPRPSPRHLPTRTTS